MDEHKQYNGDIDTKEETVVTKRKWDLSALISWITSIIISLLPVYVSLLTSLGAENKITWQWVFECITQYDILWLFSTVLLFSLFNCHTRKVNKENTKITLLWYFGIIIFVFMEITWVIFKYMIKKFTYWPIYLSIVFIVISLVISTPLQIKFIKEED